MLQVDNSFLRSKFARRIFLLFITSAVVPVIVIALLSFDHISTQLNNQSYDQARIACKAIGMELYRRLTVAHDELAAFGKALSTGKEIGAYMSPGVAQSIAPDFEDLTLLGNNGRMTVLRGHLDQKPIIDDEQRQSLAKGKTVIQTQIARENHLNVVLVQALWKIFHELAHHLFPTLWKVLGNAADAEPVWVHAIAGDRANDVEDSLSVAKHIKYRRKLPDILSESPIPDQMAGQSKKLTGQDPDVIDAFRHLDSG